MKGEYVGRSQHPFTLGAVFDGDAGEIDMFGDDVVAAEFLVLFGRRALFDWGHWVHFEYFMCLQYLVGDNQ